LIGALDLIPEPEPPAPILTLDCPECRGCGVVYSRELERTGLLYPICTSCKGLGVLTTSLPTREVKYPGNVPAKASDPHSWLAAPREAAEAA
jgi:hypothetical protein